MTLDDLSTAVVNDATDPDTKQFGIILMMIIGAVIVEVIHLIFKKWVDPQIAAKEFVKHYQSMGVVGRWKLAHQVKHQMRLHQDSTVAMQDATTDKLTQSLARQLATLTEADVLSLHQHIKLVGKL